MNKKQHEKWLKKHGVERAQIKSLKKKLGSPYSIPDYSQERRHLSTVAVLSDTIPTNGTKETSTEKADFCNQNYAMVPAYNKGPIMVVSKEDLKYAGKKL